MSPIHKYGIVLRLIEQDDAEFILKLRTDPVLNQYLSYTKPNVSDQIRWIKNYKNKEELGLEYYFIVQDQEENKFGTIRLYNFDEKSFELGSWLFLKNSPFAMAVKAHFIGFEIGFEILNIDHCKTEVRKKNISVIRYMDNFNPIIIHEDNLNVNFLLSKENFYKRKHELTIFRMHQ